MTLYSKQNPETIQSMFGSIAKSYDRTNAILSFQMHRLWNRKLMQVIMKNRKEGSYIIADLCCGTGAIALPWTAAQKMAQKIYFVDFCAEMLEFAKEKACKLKLEKYHSLKFINADVQELPLEESSVDCATLAYGIRNVNSPQKCFQEAYRILKKGGSLGILELTEPQNSFLRMGHRVYLKTALPILGKLFAKNAAAYQYLSRSIQTFVKPTELKHLLEEAGFSRVEIIPLSCGIATLLICNKL